MNLLIVLIVAVVSVWVLFGGKKEKTPHPYSKDKGQAGKIEQIGQEGRGVRYRVIS